MNRVEAARDAYDLYRSESYLDTLLALGLAALIAWPALSKLRKNRQ